MSTRTPTADIVEEAWLVMDAAGTHSVEIRLIGGLAIRDHAEDGLHPAFKRQYKDIDVVVPKGGGRDGAKLLLELGYTPNETFNVMNGNRRLLFYDLTNERQLDVFIGSFEMCHAIPVAERMHVDPRTVPLAELLLTKLQVIELNEKDRRDALALLHHHELASDDENHVNADRVAHLLAADWGLWRTTTMNLGRSRDAIGEYALTEDERERLTARIAQLIQRIDDEPKSTKWKMRDKVGDRKKWYQEPEEVD
ncbi:MAG: hypothetical protein QOF68_1683 [Gaiellales bacterium]|jgi:hypothetical protein|nr:hypothetical protein [Gaiellales bacterium]